eukprot:m.121023 g.121023  ORF g.121023 m.121023 type:complete len:1329 (-) comp15514_c0_seq1:384-4370(-)
MLLLRTLACALVLLVCIGSCHALSTQTRINGFITLTIDQPTAQDPAIVTVNATARGAEDIVSYEIYEFQDPTCQAIGNIFNPHNYAGACSPSACAAGNLAGRYPAFTNTSLSLVVSDPLITLFGSATVSGRSLVIRNASGIIGCAGIGIPPSCPSTQYRVTPQTATKAIVCAPYTFCNTLVEYESAAATTSSDRQCMGFDTEDAVAIVVQGVTKTQFFNIERESRVILSELLSTALSADVKASILRRVYVNGTSASSPQAQVQLSIWVAAVNLDTRTVLTRQQLQTQLSTLSQAQPQTCQTAAETACSCNTTAMVTNATLDTEGCFSIGSSSYCVPTDPSCSNSFPAATVDLTTFRNSPLRLRACPTTYTPDNCLEVALKAHLIGLTTPTVISVDDITIPEVRVPPIEVQNLSLAQQGVDAMRNGAEWWRNLVQPVTLPYADINYQIQYMNDHGGMDASRAQSDGIAYGLPLCIAAAFSLLFAIFLPIVMGMMSCCRCCSCCCCHKCCGGRLDQEEPSQHKCFMYALLTLGIAVCIAVFGGLIVAADSQMVEGVNNVESAAITSLKNFELFKNNTLDQVEDVPLVLFPAALDGLFGILDTINAGVAFGVVDIVDEVAQNFLSVVRDFADEVDDSYSRVLRLQDLSNNITEQLMILNVQLTDLNDGNVDARAECNARKNDMDADPTALEAQCMVLDASFPSVPVLSAASIFATILDGLDSVRQSDLRGLATEAEARLNDIPNTIQAEIDSATQTITDEAANVQADLENQVASIRDEANNFFYNSFDVAAQMDSVHSTFSSAEPYEEYRTLFSKAAAGVFISFAVLIIMATLAGSCMYDNDLDPTQRSCGSDCAGRTLLGSIGVLVIISTIVHLIIAVVFIFSAVSGKTCDSLANDEIFQMIIDQPANWNNEYPLAAALYARDAQDQELTVHGILTACRNNSAIYSALKLDNAFDLNDLTNFTSQINVEEQLAGINIANINILPDDILSQVNAYSDIGIQDIDVNQFQSELDQLSVVSSDFSSVDPYAGLSTSLTTYQTQQPHDVSVLIAKVNHLDDVFLNATMTIATIINLQNQEIAELTDLVNQVQNLTVRVEQFGRDLLAFQDFFLSVAEAAFNVHDIVADVLSLANRFVGITTRIIRDKIAPCGLLTDSYDGMVSATCDDAQKGLDAWWFTMAMAALMAFLVTITGIKLARYFRRMKNFDKPVSSPETLPLSRIASRRKRPESDGYRNFSDDHLGRSLPDGGDSWDRGRTSHYHPEDTGDYRRPVSHRAEAIPESERLDRHGRHHPVYHQGSDVPGLYPVKRGSPPPYYEPHDYDDMDYQYKEESF